MPNINGIINRSNIAKLGTKKIRGLINATVGIRLGVPSKANVSRNCSA